MYFFESIYYLSLIFLILIFLFFRSAEDPEASIPSTTIEITASTNIETTQTITAKPNSAYALVSNLVLTVSLIILKFYV